jgi:alpha-glucosidase
VRYFGPYGDGLHMPFNFKLMQSPWSAPAIRGLVERLEAALSKFGWPNYVLGNHDYARLASRIGTEQARVAAMLLLTLRGTPTLYNGDELGMENGVIPPNKIQDPQGILLGAERTRDVARTPMQWDASPQAGFSTGEPWLPLSADSHERNVEAETKDQFSILNLYRRLIWFRRQTPALHLGSFRTVSQDNANCFCFLRAQGDQQFLIALNFFNQPQQLSLDIAKPATIVLSTNLDREGSVGLGNLQLRANEGLLLGIKN